MVRQIRLRGNAVPRVRPLSCCPNPMSEPLPVQSPRIGAEIGATVRLALPLVLTQLAGIGVNVLEIAMAGRLDARVMGAVAVGTNVWFFAVMGLTGVMMALSPNVAQFDGGGRRGEAAGLFRQSMWLAGAVGIFAFLVMQVGAPVLVRSIGIDAGLADEAIAFVRASSYGAPAIAGYVGCRGLTEGLSMPRPSLGFALLGIAVLFPLGWLLLFVLGQGAEGMGLAMTLTAWVQFLGFLVFIRRSPRYRDLDWASGRRGPDGAVLWGLFRLGGPMSVSLMMESGLFNSTALVIGRFGEVAVAGHQIALSIASVTFMVPLGFAISTTVRVGNAVGQGDYGRVRRAAVIGLALALASQVVAAGLMLAMPAAIAGFYASDPDVVAFGAGLLFLAALFQLSDGAQVVAAAALRGLKDARVPMLVTAVAYWGVGMPVGLWLTFGRGWQAPGMWGGLIAGLSVAAVLLWWRFARLSRRLMLR